MSLVTTLCGFVLLVSVVAGVLVGKTHGVVKGLLTGIGALIAMGGLLGTFLVFVVGGMD